MQKFITGIKNKLKSINFKSKKTLLFIGILAIVVTSGAILISYGYYTVKGDKTLVIGTYGIVGDNDITLKIYQEERDSSGNGTGSYVKAFYVPRVNYTYAESKTKCSNGVTVTGYANYEFTVSATQRGTCSVYFDAVDGFIVDGDFRLFVEQNQGAGDYEELGRLPNNDYMYTVNTTKTTCSDTSAVVSIVNHEIQVSTTKQVSCEIYADIAAAFGGHVSLDTLSGKVLSLRSSTDYISSQDATEYRIIDQNGTRYEGNDPDNYLTFNDESWRIIGIFEGSTIGLEAGKYYPKIIKNTTIGDSAWDTNGVNLWRTSTKYAYLNGTYLSSLSSDASAMIMKAKWFLGGMPSTGFYASAWYNRERGTLGANGTTDPLDLSVSAKIGLMYVSDYGYAMYGGSTYYSCDNTLVRLNAFNSSACAQHSWLFNSVAEHTITSYDNHAERAMAIAANGNPGYTTVTVKRVTRPVVYLSSDVKIVQGNGTLDDPYKISLS